MTAYEETISIEPPDGDSAPIKPDADPVEKDNISNSNGWISGGGMVIEHSQNPWFIHNTTDIEFCIMIGDRFNEIKDQIPPLVEQAFNFWRKEFAAVNPTIGSFQETSILKNNSILIATQNISINSTCNGSEDISFQFGILNEDQKKYLGDLSKIIGVSVRTSYDTKNLRGKGFLFFNNDHGNDSFYNASVTEKAWITNPKRLLHGIIHELGHVFGVPHLVEGQIMKQDYLELLTKKESTIDLQEVIPETDGAFFFSFRKGQIKEDCNENYFTARPFQNYTAWWNLTQEVIVNCIKVEISDKIETVELYVKNISDEYIKTGIFKFPKLPDYLGDKIATEYKDFLTFYLPEEQMILKSFIHKPRFQTLQVSGTYQTLFSVDQYTEFGLQPNNRESFDAIATFSPSGKVHFRIFNGSEFLSLF